MLAHKSLSFHYMFNTITYKFNSYKCDWKWAFGLHIEISMAVGKLILNREKNNSISFNPEMPSYLNTRWTPKFTGDNPVLIF